MGRGRKGEDRRRQAQEEEDQSDSIASSPGPSRRRGRGNVTGNDRDDDDAASSLTSPSVTSKSPPSSSKRPRRPGFGTRHRHGSSDASSVDDDDDDDDDNDGDESQPGRENNDHYGDSNDGGGDAFDDDDGDDEDGSRNNSKSWRHARANRTTSTAEDSDDDSDDEELPPAKVVILPPKKSVLTSKKGGRSPGSRGSCSSSSSSADRTRRHSDSTTSRSRGRQQRQQHPRQRPTRGDNGDDGRGDDEEDDHDEEGFSSSSGGLPVARIIPAAQKPQEKQRRAYSSEEEGDKQRSRSKTLSAPHKKHKSLPSSVKPEESSPTSATSSPSAIHGDGRGGRSPLRGASLASKKRKPPQQSSSSGSAAASSSSKKLGPPPPQPKRVSSSSQGAFVTPKSEKTSSAAGPTAELGESLLGALDMMPMVDDGGGEDVADDTSKNAAESLPPDLLLFDTGFCKVTRPSLEVLEKEAANWPRVTDDLSLDQLSYLSSDPEARKGAHMRATVDFWRFVRHKSVPLKLGALVVHSLGNIESISTCSEDGYHLHTLGLKVSRLETCFSDGRTVQIMMEVVTAQEAHEAAARIVEEGGGGSATAAGEVIVVDEKAAGAPVTFMATIQGLDKGPVLIFGPSMFVVWVEVLQKMGQVEKADRIIRAWHRQKQARMELQSRNSKNSKEPRNYEPEDKEEVSLRTQVAEALDVLDGLRTTVRTNCKLLSTVHGSRSPLADLKLTHIPSNLDPDDILGAGGGSHSIEVESSMDVASELRVGFYSRALDRLLEGTPCSSKCRKYKFLEHRPHCELIRKKSLKDICEMDAAMDMDLKRKESQWAAQKGRETKRQRELLKRKRRLSREQERSSRKRKAEEAAVKKAQEAAERAKEKAKEAEERAKVAELKAKEKQGREEERQHRRVEEKILKNQLRDKEKLARTARRFLESEIYRRRANARMVVQQVAESEEMKLQTGLLVGGSFADEDGNEDSGAANSELALKSDEASDLIPGPSGGKELESSIPFLGDLSLSERETEDLIRLWDFLHSFKKPLKLERVPSLEDIVSSLYVADRVASVSDPSSPAPLPPRSDVRKSFTLLHDLAGSLVCLMLPELMKTLGLSMDEVPMSSLGPQLDGYCTWQGLAHMCLIISLHREMGLDERELAFQLIGGGWNPLMNGTVTQQASMNETDRKSMKLLRKRFFWKNLSRRDNLALSILYSLAGEDDSKRPAWRNAMDRPGSVTVKLRPPSNPQTGPGDWRFHLRNVCDLPESVTGHTARWLKAELSKALELAQKELEEMGCPDEKHSAVDEAVGFIQAAIDLCPALPETRSHKPEPKSGKTQFVISEVRKSARRCIKECAGGVENFTADPWAQYRSHGYRKDWEHRPITREELTQALEAKEQYKATATSKVIELEKELARMSEEAEEDDEEETNASVAEGGSDNGSSTLAATNADYSSLPATVVQALEMAKSIPAVAPEPLLRCQSILISLLLMPECAFILDVVDPSTHTGYYDFVQRPQALRDVIERLKKEATERLAESSAITDDAPWEDFKPTVTKFVEDVRLIVANAQCFDGVGGAISAGLHRLLCAFERLVLDWIVDPMAPPPASLSDEICCGCSSISAEGKDAMVSCDRCNATYHTKCVDLKKALTDWSCLNCAMGRTLDDVDPLVGTTVSLKSKATARARVVSVEWTLKGVMYCLVPLPTGKDDWSCAPPLSSAFHVTREQMEKGMTLDSEAAALPPPRYLGVPTLGYKGWHLLRPGQVHNSPGLPVQLDPIISSKASALDVMNPESSCIAKSILMLRAGTGIKKSSDWLTLLTSLTDASVGMSSLVQQEQQAKDAAMIEALRSATAEGDDGSGGLSLPKSLLPPPPHEYDTLGDDASVASFLEDFADNNASDEGSAFEEEEDDEEEEGEEEEEATFDDDEDEVDDEEEEEEDDMEDEEEEFEDEPELDAVGKKGKASIENDAIPPRATTPMSEASASRAASPNEGVAPSSQQSAADSNLKESPAANGKRPGPLSRAASDMASDGGPLASGGPDDSLKKSSNRVHKKPYDDPIFPCVMFQEIKASMARDLAEEMTTIALTRKNVPKEQQAAELAQVEKLSYDELQARIEEEPRRCDYCGSTDLELCSSLVKGQTWKEFADMCGTATSSAAILDDGSTNTPNDAVSAAHSRLRAFGVMDNSSGSNGGGGARNAGFWIEDPMQVSWIPIEGDQNTACAPGALVVQGSLAVHEFCAQAMLAARLASHAKIVGRFRKDILENAAHAFAGGRSLPVGQDRVGRLYWQFTHASHLLFIEPSAKAISGAPPSSGWLVLGDLKDLARVVLRLNPHVRHELELSQSMIRRYTGLLDALRDHTFVESVLQQKPTVKEEMEAEAAEESSKGSSSDGNRPSAQRPSVEGSPKFRKSDEVMVLTVVEKELSQRAVVSSDGKWDNEGSCYLYEVAFLGWGSRFDCIIEESRLMKLTPDLEASVSQTWSAWKRNMLVEMGKWTYAPDLFASTYMNHAHRARGSAPPPVFRREDLLTDDLLRAKAALLTVHAALPVGALLMGKYQWQNDGEGGELNVDLPSRDPSNGFTELWLQHVEQAQTAEELMEAVLLLESCVSSKWLHQEYARMYNVVPSQAQSLRTATLGLVMLRIWILDRILLYDYHGSKSSSSKKKKASIKSGNKSKK